MVAIRKSAIQLRVADGSAMAAYVARPPGRRRHPGLIVLQEAFGVNAHIRDVARRFAREGYVAIAPELYHRTAPGFEGDYSDFESVRPHFQALTVAGLEADLHASHARLTGDSSVDANRVAAVGFCLGGRVSFLADTALPLRGAISFYGGGIAPGLLDRAARLSGPMLFFWGGLDKHIPQDQRGAVADALRQAGRRFVNVEVSDADHGFFCDARASYNAAAARQAWALSLEFLRTVLE